MLSRKDVNLVVTNVNEVGKDVNHVGADVIEVKKVSHLT